MAINYFRQLNRLAKTTDKIGLIQHSNGPKPNLKFGYSIDDASRGLIVWSRVYPEFDYNEKSEEIHKIYLNFISKARRKDGFFNNFYEIKNNKWGWRVEDSDSLQDSYGRVLWAFSEFIHSNYPLNERKTVKEVFLKHMKFAEDLHYNSSIAFSLLGLTGFSKKPDEQIKKIIKNLSENLADNFKKNSTGSWKWFSDKMDYCNARLPQAMILAGKSLNKKNLISIGKKSLDFLIQESFRQKDGELIFHAIGNKGWFKKGDKKPAEYDEQSVEAGDMVEACVDASQILENSDYREYAKIAFKWFSGANSRGESMLDLSGGVYDAITETEINKHQGAESLLSYLLAATRL